MSYTPITVAYGDGIGPEIMDATLFILKEAGAKLTIETIEVGKECYEKGCASGIPDSAWEKIEANKILLKAPITTPQGGGYKSLNVTMRKALGLYANVRPTISYHPYITTKHPKMDLVIIRENEEDLYAGIEYRNTNNTYCSLKLFTKTGCEKIIRFAFEYAIKNNRKKVSCFSKDNIMKMTDGLFHAVFNEIARDYPEIETDHYIVDIATARLANKPEIFDVIVTSNLFGDIISDVAAEIAGSVGLAGSANIGDQYALFEAIHGSAPDIAGRGIANPSGLLNGAIMMLSHMGHVETAGLIHNAWLTTMEDGMHTGDIYNPANSKANLGTNDFAKEVVKRLGKMPQKFKPVEYKKAKDLCEQGSCVIIPCGEQKQLVGVDVFIQDRSQDVTALADKINKLTTGELQLQSISSRGLSVWPKRGSLIPIKDDTYNLRFVPNNSEKITTHSEIISLLNKLNSANIDFVKTENLQTYDGKLGFSLGQGE
jgi:isocitrate dehydrogenase